MALTKVKLIADGVITSANLDASHGITTSNIGEGSNLYYTDARVSSYLSTNGFATQTDIVAAITDSAPVTLDTLNELAAALGDDPNFATTTATSLGLKAPLASPSFTGNATFAGDVTINGSFTSQGIDDNADATAITINGNEEVGIGTTSPTYKLHVAGTTAITGNLTMSTSAEIRSSDGTGIRLRNAANSANEGGFVRSGLWKGDSSRDPSLFAETGLGLRFYTGGSATERMLINSSGNVGIGTSSPAQLLNLSGNTNSYTTAPLIRFDSTSTASANVRNWAIGPADSTYGNFHIYKSTTRGGDPVGTTQASTFTINYNGNVGIGTTSPSSTFQIGDLSSNVSASIQGSGTAGIEVRTNSAGGRIAALEQYFGNEGSLWLYLNNTTKVLLRANGDSYFNGGNVGIGTTSPSYKLSVIGSFYSNSIITNTYSDANSPPAAYVGIGPAAHNSGGKFRLGQVISSSSANATNVPVVTTYSSGHWGSQPTFFLEFAVTYYRPSYIKYYCQHEVSGTRMNIIEGPYGGQISSTPLSVTVTQLCSSCHGGQPVYKAVWKWSNNGTYLRTAPFITMFGNPASPVYTDGDSSESAIDTLYGGSSTPGHGYLLHSINNTQAAGHPRLSTQT